MLLWVVGLDWEGWGGAAGLVGPGGRGGGRTGCMGWLVGTFVQHEKAESVKYALQTAQGRKGWGNMGVLEKIYTSLRKMQKTRK